MKALSITVERDDKGKFKRWNYGPLADRFWAKVDKTGSCWLWLGARNKQGYGSLKVSGRMCRANRISYELEHGPIPDGMFVMHTCDNPPCVNPAHLVLGAPVENTHDMISKGRSNTDYRAAQLLGAQAKFYNTETVTLPSVVRGVRELMVDGIKPTQRHCRVIPGYNSIQRYLPQAKLIAMARGDIPCVL